MNVSFKGIEKARVIRGTILEGTSVNAPYFPEFQNARTNVIRLECSLSNPELNEFKQSIAESKSIPNLLLSKNLTEHDTLTIDLIPINKKNQYKLLFNGYAMPQNERAIFKTITFLCNITKKLEAITDSKDIAYTLGILNTSLAKIGKLALKNVW